MENKFKHKYLFVLDNFDVIEQVVPIDYQPSYHDLLGIRISVPPYVNVYFLCFENPIEVDKDKYNLVIYDSKFMYEGFHPAVFYPDVKDAEAKHVEPIIGKSVLNSFILSFGDKKTLNLLQFLGISYFVTIPKIKYQEFLEDMKKSIDELKNSV
jgi:hypothetical protein